MMKIEDDLKMHSHYIEELFESDKALRERTHSINERLGIHTFMLEENGKILIDAIKNLKEVREIMDKLNCDYASRRTIMQFVLDIFEGKPKNWLVFFGLIVILECVLGMPNILKHLLGW